MRSRLSSKVRKISIEFDRRFGCICLKASTIIKNELSIELSPEANRPPRRVVTAASVWKRDRHVCCPFVLQKCEPYYGGFADTDTPLSTNASRFIAAVRSDGSMVNISNEP